LAPESPWDGALDIFSAVFWCEGSVPRTSPAGVVNDSPLYHTGGGSKGDQSSGLVSFVNSTSEDL
jgi:hypothetical protein